PTRAGPFTWSEPQSDASDHLIGRRLAILTVDEVLVTRTAIFHPRFERARQLHLNSAAEPNSARVVVEFVETARGGERLGVERRVTDLAVGGDARRQSHAHAATHIVLASGFQTVARSGKAIGEPRRTVAGGQLTLDADKRAAEAEVVPCTDPVDRGIGIGAESAVGRLDIQAFIAGERSDIKAAGRGILGQR